MVRPISTRGHFAALRRSKARARVGPIGISYVPADDLALAFAIPRNFGTAPERNTARRKIREVFRSKQDHLPAGMYLVRPDPALLTMDHDALVSAVVAAVAAATK